MNVYVTLTFHNMAIFFLFLKANNFTKRQYASRTESVVSENCFMINLEKTGVAVKWYKQISIGD